MSDKPTDSLEIKPCSVCGELVAWDDTEPVVCCDCESTDLQAEVARLRKALEEIAGIDTSPNQYPWQERMDEIRAIAAAALEGKDGTT